VYAQFQEITDIGGYAMQRFLAGLLCFFALYALNGCAALRNTSNHFGIGASQPNETKASAPNPKANETKVPALTREANQTEVSAPIGGTVQTCALNTIAGTVQTCALDTGICIALPTPPAGTPGKGAPVAQIPEKSFDFGVMREDKDFIHKFQIKNIGTAELTIKKIIPD
jgi:hypothetical protein